MARRDLRSQAHRHTADEIEIAIDVPAKAVLFRTPGGRLVVEVFVDGVLLFDEDLTSKPLGWGDWARSEIAKHVNECTHPTGIVSESGDVLCGECGEHLAEDEGRTPP